MTRPSRIPWCPVPEVLAEELLERLGRYDAEKLKDELGRLLKELDK